VAGLRSADAACAWAHAALKEKNSLHPDDAKAVEEAFERKLAEFKDGEHAGDSSGGIDENVISGIVPRRRNREHLRFVAQQPCLVCGRKPSDPHHLRFMQPRALGRKVSDEFAVPLCRVHHRALHRTGDEHAWWNAAGIDPVREARQLWMRTHGKEDDLPVTSPIPRSEAEPSKPTA
jgi:hypothetical protein